jgi:lipoyl-dependent peroxiredoxin
MQGGLVMPMQTSKAIWEGSLKDGQGTLSIGKTIREVAYSFSSRFGNGEGTSPEELIGAAHAGCFSMLLANNLANLGYTAARIQTIANVHLERIGEHYEISKIDLDTEAKVPGLDERVFLNQAHMAKRNCPISRLCGITEITLHARLLN